MQKKILALTFLLSLTNLRAATFCIRNGGGGANNGSDWNNAFSQMPSPQVAGSTYYYAAGQFNGFTLNSSGVTVKKAIPTDHGPDTGWIDSMANGQVLFQSTFININAANCTIDGQTGGGPGSWNTGYGIKVVSPLPPACQGVIMAQGNNTVIRHCDVEGDHGDQAGCGSGNDCIQNNTRANPITISFCSLHDAGRCLVVNRADNLLMEYIYGGVYEYFDPGDHSEILVSDSGTFPNTPDCVDFRTNIVVRNSLFTVCLGTGGLMITADGAQIYGNVFYNAPTDTRWGYSYDGAVCGAHDSGDLIRNVKIYHNTFIDATRFSSDPALGVVGQYVGTGFNPCNTPNVAFNNLFYLKSSPRLDYCSSHDFNAAVNLSQGSISEPNGIIKTVASLFTSPATLNFTLVTNITGTALDGTYNNIDPSGNVRATHTVGAFEFGSGGPNTNPIIAISPLNLSFGVTNSPDLTKYFQ